jgi:hypothetical protein
MKRFPLFFRFDEMVLGNGFVAGVRVDGRATAEVQDDGSVWIFGVYPGAMAEGGPDLSTAFALFRLMYRRYLVDVAVESSTFLEFQAEVERDFFESSPEAIAEWEEARRLVRAGNQPVESMPRDTTDRPLQIVVANLQLQATENRLEDDPQPSVAA